MKRVSLILVLVLIAILSITTLSGCGFPLCNWIESARTEPHAYIPPVEAPAIQSENKEDNPELIPQPKPVKPEKPQIPIDNNGSGLIPDTQNTEHLADYEAADIVNAWISNNSNMLYDPNHRIDIDIYRNFDHAVDSESYLAGFRMFGEHYYEFMLLFDNDAGSYIDGIRVHYKTGELLFQGGTNSDGLYFLIDESEINEWYRTSNITYAQPVLTPEDSLSIYDNWVNGLNADSSTEIPLLYREANWLFVITGEPYYLFRTEDPLIYLHRVLVHAVTGEMLIMYYDINGYGILDKVYIDHLNDWPHRIPPVSIN